MLKGVLEMDAVDANGGGQEEEEEEQEEEEEGRATKLAAGTGGAGSAATTVSSGGKEKGAQKPQNHQLVLTALDRAEGVRFLSRVLRGGEW